MKFTPLLWPTLKKPEQFQRFYDFLPQINGQLFNALEIAERLGVDYKTVQFYLKCLCEKDLAFVLPGYRPGYRRVEYASIRLYLKAEQLPTSFSLACAQSLYAFLQTHQPAKLTLSLYDQRQFNVRFCCHPSTTPFYKGSFRRSDF